MLMLASELARDEERLDLDDRAETGQPGHGRGIVHNPLLTSPGKGGQALSQKASREDLDPLKDATQLAGSEPTYVPTQAVRAETEVNSQAIQNLDRNQGTVSSGGAGHVSAPPVRAASDIVHGGTAEQSRALSIDAVFGEFAEVGNYGEMSGAADAASEATFAQELQPGNWQQPWTDAALASTSLLVADGNSTSDHSTGQQLADAVVPLSGLLFAWGLTLTPGNQRQQSTILLVDNDDTTRDAITVALVREGYLVLAVATARDAVNVIRAPLSRIDLVLLDLDLPDVNGIHLCQRLRELFPRLPTVVCTGEAEPEAVGQLAAVGVQHYLQKPIAGETLLATVQSLLRMGNPG
jgi:CheY-like chemotaxis protein